MGKFTFLKVYNSPFITPKIRFYCGKLRYGTPIFYPRNWRNKPDKNGNYAIPKKIGFDFVGLGWKTKWEADDYRHEWNPIWSFVFFKWQFCVFFDVPADYHYWCSWLYYELNTDHKLSQKERIELTKTGFPQKWISYSNGEQTPIDYYPSLLKKKYL